MNYAIGFLAVVGVVAGIIFWQQDRITRFFFAPTESAVPEGTARGSDTGEAPRTVSEGLRVPWGMIFLPDGSMLVTERTGTIAQVSEEGIITRFTVVGVREGGEGGLLGIAKHPNFAVNQWIYVYLTYNAEDGIKNRVARYTYENGTIADPVTILDGIPGSSNHDGGRLAFGPDGYLYVTTGDAGRGANAQETDVLAGKILRVNDDGSVPEDNPFGNEVYSYGHRNPQGLAWDGEGRLWATEHGRSGAQSGYDELNLIERGGNYGWPIIEGDEARDGMITPVVHSGARDTWAPASLAYHEGKLYWGGLRGESLYEATIAGRSVEDLRAHFRSEYGRIRDTVISSDGTLYFTTSNTDGRGMPREGDDKLITLPVNVLH